MLSNKIFRAKNEKKKLEKIIHPLVKIKRKSFIENNIPSVFYSLEMSSRSVMYRIISILSKVELKRIFQAKELTDSDFEKIGKAVELIEKSNFFIDDTSALSPSEILSRSRKLKREQPELGLIVIDYLQLMKADQSNPSRVNEISEISRATKALAKELDIPVIALSQLNRASETRTNKVPILADMRDSGALEQDADLVIFPFRPEFHEPTPENKGIARIIVAKHRTVKLEKAFCIGLRDILHLKISLQMTRRMTIQHLVIKIE
mgnify:CR=1 FL=1